MKSNSDRSGRRDSCISIGESYYSSDDEGSYTPHDEQVPLPPLLEAIRCPMDLKLRSHLDGLVKIIETHDKVSVLLDYLISRDEDRMITFFSKCLAQIVCRMNPIKSLEYRILDLSSSTSLTHQSMPMAFLLSPSMLNTPCPGTKEVPKVNRIQRHSMRCSIARMIPFYGSLILDRDTPAWSVRSIKSNCTFLATKIILA